MDTNIRYNILTIFSLYRDNIVSFNNDEIRGILYGAGLKGMFFDLTVIETDGEGGTIFKEWSLNDTKLVLRELDQINDVELEFIKNLLGEKFISPMFNNKNLLKSLLNSIYLPFEISFKLTLYLLKIGINMPFESINGKTPIEIGIAIKLQ